MNFEELTKKFKKIGKDTVTEVQKMNEIRQLTARVNEEKKQLNSIYMEMGKKLYEQCKDAPMEGFESEIQSIEEKFSMIDLLQDQIRGVKGVSLCPNCNMEVGAGERFCSNCGGRMPEVITIEDKAEDNVVLETEADGFCEDVEECSEDADETVVDEVLETAEEAAEDVDEAVADAAETVKETVADAAETVKETVADAAETVNETVTDAAEAVKETVTDAAEK